MAWRLADAGLFLLAALATFTYSRPSIVNMVVYHGRTDDVLAANVRLWVPSLASAPSLQHTHDRPAWACETDLPIYGWPTWEQLGNKY
jgi:hypothetical protein